jgi:hypothetical protein
LLCNEKIKVEDASRARFDRLACLTGSLAKYVTVFVITPTWDCRFFQ